MHAHKKLSLVGRIRHLADWLCGSTKPEPIWKAILQLLTVLLLIPWIALISRGYTTSDAEMNFLYFTPIVLFFLASILSFIVKSRIRWFWAILSILLLALIAFVYILFSNLHIQW